MVIADPNARAVIADPEENNNLRSLRAFEKAGFRATKTVQRSRESFRRRVVRLPQNHP
jgi:RimJ/RimL family protein N-acetyltransferase